jgi:methyltransferase (EC 2.1.1.-)
LLREIARDILGEDIARAIWKRLEVLGDVAIIRKPPDLDVEIELYKRLSNEIMKRLPYVKSVWLAVSPVLGPYRVREFIHLAGEPRSETVYKEHGCLFKLDFRKVYVSPALNYSMQGWREP